MLVDGQREPLGKRALDILSVLAEANGGIVTKDELLEAVWPGVIVEENALQVHVVALRKALGPEADRLKTIRGVGYQLDIDGPDSVPPVTALEPATDPGAATQPPVQPVGAPAEPPRRRSRFTPPRRTVLLALSVLVLLAGAWGLYEAFKPASYGRIPVVVRQLTPVGTDPTARALAAGITDELIVRLRQIPELRIATADADGTVPSAAFEGAYFVDGTLRSSGDQLRVTARLHDGDGEILWSQVFDKGLVDLFDVQEEIASSIAGALSVSFVVGGNSPAYGGTDNPEAYAAYMQYQAHLLDPDFDTRPYLERAVALDPKYAKARAALNGDYGLQISLAPPASKGALLDKMDRDTRAALAATPDLWIPHAGRGMYYAYRHDFVAADREFERVASLDKGNDPEQRSFLANYQMLLGRVKKATSGRQSNELIDPIERDDPFRVYDLEMKGRFQDSINLYRRLEQKGQAGVTGFVPHVFIELLLTGREAEAIQFVEQHGQPRYGEMLAALKEDPALTTLSERELRAWARERYPGLPEFDLARSALMAGHLGHPQLAVGLLRLAFEGPSAGALWSLWHPALAEARRTDEFEDLVTDLGFVKAWRASGDWGDYCRPVSASEITCS